MRAVPRFPRVLIVDPTALGGLSSTGQLKATLFRGWPEARLLQIHEDRPAWRLCILPGGEAVREPPEIVDDDQALVACARFRPDLIYYRPVGSALLDRFAWRVAEFFRIPVFVHIMDDWPAALALRNPGLADRLDYSLRAMLGLAHHRFSIGDAMSAAFGARYGVPFTPVANGADLADYPPLPAPETTDDAHPFVIRYVGNLAPDMTLASLRDVAEAVHDVRTTVDVRLEIHATPTWLPAASAIPAGEGVRVHAARLEPGAYRTLLRGADALLIAYNFDLESTAYIRYSVANKMPESLATGRPVLAYGPDGVATIDALRTHGCAELVTRRDPAALRRAILTLAVDAGRRRMLGEAGRRVAFERYAIDGIRSRFQGLLRAAEDTPVPADWPALLPAIERDNDPLVRTLSDLLRDTPQSDRLFVLGNGPSLRGFDFRRLDGFDTVGMNAAYRHWHDIGWYPTYYCCLDTVVAASHHGAIRELVDDRAINGIRLFFLRRSILAEEPALAEVPEVVFLEDWQEVSALLRGVETITTGAVATLFGAALGYRVQHLLGTDCDYVERLDVSRPVEGIILEISEDPPHNPNYFFDGYQRKGDRYHVPNPRPDLHRESWRLCGDVLARYGVRVTNANPRSRLDTFPMEDLETALAAGRRIAGRPQPALADSLTVDLEAPPPGAGWHLAEHDGAVVFRWTGPQPRATLRLAIQREREGVVEVAIRDALTADQLDGLVVEVDGEPIPPLRTAGTTPVLVTARLPPRANSQRVHATEIALVLPRTLSPAGVRPGSADLRRLGLAVAGVRVRLAHPGEPDSAEALVEQRFDEAGYRRHYPDVAAAVQAGAFASGFEHYVRHGRAERRVAPLRWTDAPLG